MCLLLGYGAAAVNPYLAFETIEDLIAEGSTEIHDPQKAITNYIKACGKGVLKVMSKMGISTVASYTGAQIFEAIGLSQTGRRRVLHRNGEPARWCQPRSDRRRGAAAAIADAYPTNPAERALPHARRRRRVPVATRRRAPPLQSGDGLQAATRQPDQAVRRLQGVHEPGRRPGPGPGHLARLVPLRHRCAAVDLDRRGRAGQRDREAVQHRRHVVRLDLGRGPRDLGGRDEPARGAIEHRRGRRGPRTLRAAAERRLEAKRDQTGRVGAVRGHERVPRQRRRPADQDGPGREARRGRPATGAQGVPVDRQDPAFDTGCRAHQPAAAPRHLLDRGSGPADPRPEERQPVRPGAREAGGRGRRGHGGGGCVEGARRRRAHLGSRRWHRRLAAHVAQARRRAVGARSGRDAADAAVERPARPHRRSGRRADEDRSRRRDRCVARRRGVRVRHGAARRVRAA